MGKKGLPFGTTGLESRLARKLFNDSGEIPQDVGHIFFKY